MLQSLIFLLTSLIVFLILTETVTVKFYRGESSYFEIGLTLFAIRFSHGGQKKQKKTKSKTKKRKSYYSLLLRLIKGSDLKIAHLDLYVPSSSEASFAVKYGLFNSLLSSFLVYADNNSKNFKLGTITFSNSGDNNYKIFYEMSIELSLISAFKSYALWLIFDKEWQPKATLGI